MFCLHFESLSGSVTNFYISWNSVDYRIQRIKIMLESRVRRGIEFWMNHVERKLSMIEKICNRNVISEFS